MGKKKQAKKHRDAHAKEHPERSGDAAATGTGIERPKLKRKAYERELRHLQEELVQVQLWAQRTGAKVCIVFEGRDTAGKGGVIKRIMQRVSPRVFRVVALPAPTEREKSQMYLQRYLAHFPAAGELVIFDRSWYNRAGVELEMFQRLLDTVPLSGEQWAVVLGLSLIAPAVVWADKAIQTRRRDRAEPDAVAVQEGA